MLLILCFAIVMLLVCLFGMGILALFSDTCVTLLGLYCIVLLFKSIFKKTNNKK